MNRFQWLQVWGFNPATNPDRRGQTPPSLSADGRRAFDQFMRRAMDRPHLEDRRREAADV
jgi:hypothetical protein